MISSSRKILDKQIAEAMAADDELCMVVGRFMIAFGKAEHQITRILAHVLGYRSAEKNFEHFDYLAKNMDLRGKVQTLENAAKDLNPMGGNIAIRIKKFNGCVRDARNNLAHSELTLRKNSVHCSSLGKHVSGGDPNVRPSGRRAPSYSVNQLLEWTLWLLALRADLEECAEHTWFDRPFEVAHPRSSE